MSNTSPNPLDCSPDIVGGLIETITAALLDNFPSMTAAPEDIEFVLDALRVLRPKLAELDTFEGLMCMQGGRWDDAIHAFQRVIAGAPNFSYAKALMAFCLSVTGDENWRRTASEALESNPNRDTRRLVRALEAREDLRKAIAAYQASGKFEIPLSVAELNDDAEPDSGTGAPREAAPSSSAGEAAQQNYLRV
jgi:type III secretion protein HrpB1